jgi:hypothetical protein
MPGQNLIILSLLLLAVAVTLLFAIFQHLQLRNSILLYGNIDFSKGKVRIGRKEYHYLILSTPDLQKVEEITFQGVDFSYRSSSYLLQPSIEQLGNDTGIQYEIKTFMGNGTTREYRHEAKNILISDNNLSMIVIWNQNTNNMSRLISFPGNSCNLLLFTEYFKNRV